jgi:hypothetical protein
MRLKLNYRKFGSLVYRPYLSGIKLLRMKMISILSAGYGHFKISTMYRGKLIGAVTTNTQAIDRYRDTNSPAKCHLDVGYTRNQAARALYEEIKRVNAIN